MVGANILFFSQILQIYDDYICSGIFVGNGGNMIKQLITLLITVFLHNFNKSKETDSKESVVYSTESMY